MGTGGEFLFGFESFPQHGLDDQLHAAAADPPLPDLHAALQLSGRQGVEQRFESLRAS